MSRAVAGATRIRSAAWPIFVCGIGVSGSSHSRVLHGLAGERRQGGGAEEVLGTLRHDRHDVGAGVDETPADLDGLVGSDAPGDAEDDPLPGEHVGRDSAGVGVEVGPPAGRSSGRPRPAAGASVLTILSTEISSKAMLNGLRAVDDTCGGTMWPRPSPSWLKYELMLRARRAASVTRLNLESTCSSRPFDRGLHHRVVALSHGPAPSVALNSPAILSTARQADQRHVRQDRPSTSRAASLAIDDRQHLVDRAIELVVDHDVIGQVTADRLFRSRPCAAGRAPCGRGRRGRAAGAPAPRATAAARRSGAPAGYCCFTCWAPSSSISSTMSGAPASSRCSGRGVP